MTHDAPRGTLLPTHEPGPDGARTASWDDVTSRFAAGGWCWLATNGPDGTPQPRPLFAVWSAPSFYIASKGATRKSRNLAADARCSLALPADDLHVVVEGRAERVVDDARLAAAAAAFADVYGWPAVPADGRLDAPYGAPTAGAPPYDVYGVTPTTAYALPVDDAVGLAPTRFAFPVGAAR